MPIKKSSKSVVVTLKLVIAISITGIFTACGGSNASQDPPEESVSICSKINNTSYYGKRFSVGYFITPEYRHHTSIWFDAGEFLARDSDYGVLGSYVCDEHGDITAVDLAGNPEEFNFSDDLDTLTSNVIGPVEYARISSNPEPYPSCSSVSGRRFIDVASSLNDSSDGLNPPEIALFFDNVQGVELYEFGVLSSGFYDCEASALHIHRSETDTEPRTIIVGDDAQMTIVLDDHRVTLVEAPDYSIACQEESVIACTAGITTEPCLETPCPGYQVNTYENRCAADASGELLLRYSSACAQDVSWRDDNIGDFAPVRCSSDGASVCGKYRYGNSFKSYDPTCISDVTLTTYSFDGECGVLEDQVSMDAAPPVQLQTQGELITSDNLVSFEQPLIAQDKLFVTLIYRACAPLHFTLNVLAQESAAQVPSVSFTFNELVNSDCQEQFTTQFEYDLLPLKHWYQNVNTVAAMAVDLGDLGLYSF